MKYIKSYKLFESMSKEEQAIKFILDKLIKELPNNLPYHNIEHTTQVISAVEFLCKEEGIDDELIKVAAAYHDSGYLVKYKDNEKEGAAIAENELPNFGFNDDEIDIIYDLIMATEEHHVPKTLEEKIMKDADLSYLGYDYKGWSDRLRNEWKMKGKVYTDAEWKKSQIKFLKSHKFYSDAAKKNWDSIKKAELDKLQK